MNILLCRDLRLSELPMLRDTKRYHLLVEWNGTAEDYDRDKCVHDLFEVRMKRTPESIRVTFDDKKIISFVKARFQFGQEA